MAAEVGKRKREDLAGPGVRAFLKLQDVWELSDRDAQRLLGDVSRTTLHNWKKNPPTTVSRDTLERISYLLAIFKGLQILLPQKEQADAWIKKHNAAFGEQSPLERMLAGNVSDLLEVRQYVDHARGGDFS